MKKLRNITGHLQAYITIILILLNILWGATFIMPASLLKFIIPLKWWHNFWNIPIKFLSNNWIARNNLIMKYTKDLTIDISGDDDLHMDEWYLVISNHQSWADIFILQNIFFKKIPFLKFFLKKELMWIPFMGVAWWALDFPFMKRFSRDYIKKHPEKKGKDIEITRKACEKFKKIPVAVVNFVEGTRFTRESHNRQKSPFSHLLKPKAGGISFVLSAMGGQLRSILNTTIVYPEGDPSFYSFISGKTHRVTVHIEKLPITEKMFGNYENDEQYKTFFQSWLNDLWLEKDKRIQGILEKNQQKPKSVL